MENVRKIVREELINTFQKLFESNTLEKNYEEIIYNFDAGRAFGINKLSKDIQGLDAYYMSSYFPSSEMKESWMFEVDTNYGGSQVIEITHQIGPEYKSLWKLNIAESNSGSGELYIIATSGTIEGYEDFVNKANSTLNKNIDTRLL